MRQLVSDVERVSEQVGAVVNQQQYQISRSICDDPTRSIGVRLITIPPRAHTQVACTAHTSRAREMLPLTASSSLAASSYRGKKGSTTTGIE